MLKRNDMAPAFSAVDQRVTSGACLSPAVRRSLRQDGRLIVRLAPSVSEGFDLFTKILCQARRLLPFLASLYILPLLFLCAVVVASRQTGLDMAMLMRDPAAIAHLNPFTGVASNLGALLWSAAATICLFSWAVLRHRAGQAEFSRFILCSGLVTTLLMLDDFFLLHEHMFPRYLGVNEKLVYLGYMGVVLAWLVVFRKQILKTDYLLLLLALGLFALSVFVDAIQYRLEPLIGNWRMLLEDGGKFLGIVGWLGYFFRCCRVAIGDGAQR